jgi:hypothetical protein
MPEGLSDLHRARHRGSARLDECGSAGLRGHDSRQERRHQRPEIGKPVRFRLKYDDGNRDGNEILLKGQVSIYRDKRIEVFGGKCQQLAIRDGRPPHLASGLDVVADDITRQCPEPEVRAHRAANAIANFGFKGALES